MSLDIRKTIIAEIFLRTWTDSEFRDQLVSNPADTLTECGFSFSKGMKITVFEDTPERINVVLPAAPWVIPTHLTLSPYIEDDVPTEQKVIADMNVKIWYEPDFKELLLSDPSGVLAGVGVTIPAGVEIVVHENTAQKMHLALPVPPNRRAASDAELANLAEAAVVGVTVSKIF